MVFFLRFVNKEKGKILLADKTINGCVIAAVVNDGLRAAQIDCGGGVWVIPVIIIA